MIRKRNTLMITIVTALAVAFAGMALAGSTGKAGLAEGDEAYFCQCGEKCPCDTVSNNPGKCTCGVDLAKGKVTAASGDELTADVNGESLKYKADGQYACNCGPACTCNTISQNPGKCTCGVDMKKVQ